VQDELFWDREGGWYSTTGTDASVLVRMKEEYDGAEPSASGVGAMNLLTFAQLTGDASYSERAREVFGAFAVRLQSLGRALPFMAAALSAAHASPEQIIVVGPANAPATQALWQAANTKYRPFATCVPVTPGAGQRALANVMPWIGSMSTADNQPAAYVCRDFVCETPTSDPSSLL
jgi:uncharacterized protein YyaL (SSP411 family)